MKKFDKIWKKLKKQINGRLENWTQDLRVILYHEPLSNFLHQCVFLGRHITVTSPDGASPHLTWPHQPPHHACHLTAMSSIQQNTTHKGRTDRASHHLTRPHQPPHCACHLATMSSIRKKYNTQREESGSNPQLHPSKDCVFPLGYFTVLALD
jgi:hypothetical protein